MHDLAVHLPSIELAQRTDLVERHPGGLYSHRLLTIALPEDVESRRYDLPFGTRARPSCAMQSRPAYSHAPTKQDRGMDSSLAEFELLVMLATLRLGPEEAYTVSIAEDIHQRTGRPVRR